jgi:hypothetical protein
MCDGELEWVKYFPNLRLFRKTSNKDYHYNCYAWANGDTNCYWSHREYFDGRRNYYWPRGVPRQLTLEAYVRAYEAVGFQICHDGEYEDGYEKIAIFVDSTGLPSHAARQINEQMWTSKMGDDEDIEHELHGLEGGDYGNVEKFMKRQRSREVA